MVMAIVVLKRRLHQTRYQTLFSSASRPTVHPPILALSSTRHVIGFSQIFRRTVLAHCRTLSHKLYFSTLEPCYVQSKYNPIDFSDLEGKNNSNEEIGTVEIVELVRKAKDFTSRKEAIDFLGGSDIKPDANQIYLAIWVLRNDWELALLAFGCSEKWGCLTEKLLGLIVWVLGSHQKFDVAWCLIRDFHKLVDTRQSMLAIIERYVAANHYVKAIKTFHFMEKLTVNLDQSAFYAVISALCRHGYIEEAEEFMLKNKKLFRLETEGFNIILHAWCSISVDLCEAKRVWRQMASYCITPNAVSYTHMISCFSRTGNLFDSVRLYDAMKKRGWVPGLEVYNSLLYVMTHENCLNEAFKILDKIKEEGFHPDSKSYNCLICPLCEAGKFEESRNVLAAMIQEGNMPTIETYHAFLKGANLGSTLEIFSQMKKDEVGPTCYTFLLVFDRFFKLGQPENVLKVWVEMRNYGVHPESTHYISLTNGLANCGCLIKAKELHKEMISNGLANDPKLEKLLQLPQQGNRRRRVGPVNIVRHVHKSNSPSMSRIRQHRGRRTQGSKKEREKANSWVD